MIRHRSSAFRPLSASVRMNEDRHDNTGRSETVSDGFQQKYRRHLNTISHGIFTSSTSLYPAISDNIMASDKFIDMFLNI